MGMGLTLTIRNRIRQFVDERGLTVYRLIKDTGISGTTGYALAKHPDRIPDSTTMDAICRTYKCQPGAFIEYVPDEVSGNA